MKLQRIQLSRRKGWRMPPNTLKVDRSTRWGNPKRVGDTDINGIILKTNGMCAQWFGRHLTRNPALVIDMQKTVRERGITHIACWCALGEPCHADYWIKEVEA